MKNLNNLIFIILLFPKHNVCKIVITIFSLFISGYSFPLWRQHLRGEVIQNSEIYTYDTQLHPAGTIKKGEYIIIDNYYFINKPKEKILLGFYYPEKNTNCFVDSTHIKLSEQLKANILAAKNIRVTTGSDLSEIYYKNKKLCSFKSENAIAAKETYIFSNIACIFLFNEINPYPLDYIFIDLITKKTLFEKRNEYIEFPVPLGISTDKKYYAIDYGTFGGLRQLAIYNLINGDLIFETTTLPLFNMGWTKKGLYYEKYIGKTLEGHEDIPDSEKKVYFAKCYWNGKEQVIEYFKSDYGF
ncbi:MAG: hypothetical protein KA015_04705 [Spirochaetes bacterium]|nr:hypothetical protein [Spirochaetota bacterium]